MKIIYVLDAPNAVIYKVEDTFYINRQHADHQEFEEVTEHIMRERLPEVVDNYENGAKDNFAEDTEAFEEMMESLGFEQESWLDKVMNYAMDSGAETRELRYGVLDQLDLWVFRYRGLDYGYNSQSEFYNLQSTKSCVNPFTGPAKYKK